MQPMPSPRQGPAPSLPYEEALHRLLSLADYERMAGIAAPEFKYDLERMRSLAGRLALLNNSIPIVHVAGTKGKGSVAAMTASILSAAGLRAGLYTSPHLHSFRERIRINGEPLSEDAFSAAVMRIWPAVEQMAAEPIGAPSTFEALTAMAMNVFLAENVDAAVVEVGLGGRLDATNVFTSTVAVIASLSLDHTAILGPTLHEIAAEKAGVVKGAQPVVTAPQKPEAMAVVRQRCAETGAPLAVAPADFSARIIERHGLDGQTIEIETPSGRLQARLPLLGEHQAENAALAVAAVERLPLDATPAAIEAGLADVRWDGRFQTLERSPFLIVDGAHNPHSMERLGETVRECLPRARVYAVFGASADKQLADVAQQLARFADRVYTVASRHPRAARPSELAAHIANAGGQAESVGAIGDAIDIALSQCGDSDLVLVTGSLFVVAEALQSRLGIRGEHYPEFDPQAAALGPLERTPL